MKIVVLLKQVPAGLDAVLRSDFTIDRSAFESVTNPADQRALDLALQWKRCFGAEICCVTMGPDNAAGCLKDAAVAGADMLYQMNDDRFAGADSMVTASVLCAAIRKIGDVDLVVCGRRSVDGETGQVGPGIASMLDWACVGNVTEMSPSNEKEWIDCHAVSAMETLCYRVRLPAVLCVSEGPRIPSMPSLAALYRTRHLSIIRLTPEMLGMGGLNARKDSPTRVIGVRLIERKRRRTQYLDLTGAMNVIHAMLRESGAKGD